MKLISNKLVLFNWGKVINIAWYLSVVVVLFLFAIQLYSLILAQQIGPPQDIYMMEFQTPGMVLRFSEGVTGDFFTINVHLISIALMMPILGAGLLIIYLLRKILVSLVNGTTFMPKNVIRIRIIGLAVIAITLLTGFSTIWLNQLLASSIDLQGFELLPKFRFQDFGGVLWGVIILILAEVFRQGAYLQEDKDLTI